MEFPRLNSSLALSASEQPTIYLALCLVESLFKDLEDTVGGDLSTAPTGDETLPTKMVWLSRKLQKIYTANSDALQRNRSRLDEMMQKLADSDAVLQSLAEQEERLQRLRAEKDDMVQAEAKAERCKAACDALAQEIKQAQDALAAQEAELSRLSEVKQHLLSAADAGKDRVAQAQSALAEFRAQTLAPLARELTDAQAELDALRQEKTAQEEILLQLGAQKEALQKEQAEADRCRAACEETQRERAQLRDAIAAQEAQLKQLSEEKERLLLEVAYGTDRIAQAQQSLDDVQSKELAPLAQQLSALQEELDARQQSKAAQLAQIEQLGRQRENAIRELALLMPKLDHAQEALKQKQEDLAAQKQRLDAVEQEKASVEAQVSERTELLGTIQTEILTLKNTTLPEEQAHIDDAVKRKAALQQALSALSQELETLSQELPTLEQAHETLRASLAQKQEEYAECKASYAEQSSELTALQKQLDELRGKSDRQTLRKLQAQLHADIAQMQQLEQDCQAAEQELRDGKVRLARQQAEFDRLTLEQASQQEAEQRLREAQKTLAPLATPENLQRARALSRRVQALESASAELCEARKLLCASLDTPGMADASQLSAQLDAAERGLDQLQHALLACADSIRLEEH